MRSDDEPDINSLTPRERDILKLIAQGQPNKMIARKLDITESTVKVHVKNLMKKMKVKSRVEAAVWIVCRTNSTGIRPLCIKGTDYDYCSTPAALPPVHRKIPWQHSGRAAEFGCLWIETDVQLSADGCTGTDPRRNHEPHHQRQWKVTDLTFTRNCGHWMPGYGRGGIPGKKFPLTDLLALAEESGLHLNLKLKTELTDSDHAIAPVV